MYTRARLCGRVNYYAAVAQNGFVNVLHSRQLERWSWRASYVTSLSPSLLRGLANSQTSKTSHPSIPTATVSSATIQYCTSTRTVSPSVMLSFSFLLTNRLLL